MKQFFNRIIYSTPGVHHNPLMHPFLLITAVMGFSFVFFHGTIPVGSSILYQLTIAHLPNYSASVWGVIALTVAVSHLIAIQVRKRWFGTTVTWTGVLLWLYATLLYALYGYWMQVFTGGIPNLFFWIWYSMYVKDYHERNLPKP